MCFCGHHCSVYSHFPALATAANRVDIVDQLRGYLKEIHMLYEVFSNQNDHGKGKYVLQPNSLGNTQVLIWFRYADAMQKKEVERGRLIVVVTLGQYGSIKVTFVYFVTDLLKGKACQVDYQTSHKACSLRDTPQYKHN